MVGVAIFLSIGLGLPGVAASEEHVVSGEIVVTLLGTGGPEPTAARFGPATLIQAGGLSLLFDAGRGVTVRLYQLGISSGKGIDAVFLTHYHSDHVEGLPDLWMTGYMFGPFGSRSRPLRLWGPSDGKEPSGAARIAKGLTEAFSDDTRIREADEHVTPIATEIEARDFQPDRVVFDESGVKVTAFTVDHGDLIKPSVGYRVDYGSRSVTLSGDTKFSENLINYAGGTDLLIHEVFAMSPQLATLPQLKPVADHHSSPEQAGEVFSRVRPKLAAYTHVILLGTAVEELLSRTKAVYPGPLVVGEDLLRFEVGDSITVKRWDQNLRKYSD
ncbi:MBL fold metallo-hydrolase [Bradyrhizobium sp. Pear77]|nr:MBL fold metallo-hydrolase [Bradyrhizobium altum]